MRRVGGPGGRWRWCESLTHSQQHRARAVHFVADFHEHFGHAFGWNEQIRPRPELDHSKACADGDLVTCPERAADAAGDGAGNLLHAQRSAGGGIHEIEPKLFITARTVSMPGVEILAAEI